MVRFVYLDVNFKDLIRHLNPYIKLSRLFSFDPLSEPPGYLMTEHAIERDNVTKTNK